MHTRPQYSEGNELPRVWPADGKILRRPKRFRESKSDHPDGYVFWTQKSGTQEGQSHGRIGRKRALSGYLVLEGELMISKTEKPFTFRFVDAQSNLLLELTNASDLALRSIEILTVFLKNEEASSGGPSQAHIRFEAIERILPQEKSILSHRTWINGKPAGPGQDQLERLQVRAGQAHPYVLDISWQNAEGKTRFQRIPIGH